MLLALLTEIDRVKEKESWFFVEHIGMEEHVVGRLIPKFIDETVRWLVKMIGHLLGA